MTDAVRSASRRTVAQIDALQASVTAIVEASELTSADDEHDPEGATIAYERAQAIALLRQARADMERLEHARAQLEAHGTVACIVCGVDIGVDRVEALPTADRCIGCAAR